MSIKRHRQSIVPRNAAAIDGAHSASLHELLIGGGDTRLALNIASGENAYGCTPHPRSDLLDFASTTATSISREAYDHARNAYEALLADSLRFGSDEACEAAITHSRGALLKSLGLEGAAVVFSASGTDTQLQTLFLLKQLCNGPLAAVTVGCDQTGSGAAYTWRGQHFSQSTANGAKVEKGGAIPALAGVECHEIGFSGPGGELRTSSQMDESVLAILEKVVPRHELVILQTMEASKFGWKAPSDACVEEACRRWPGRIRIVADACQLRVSRERLSALLSQGQCVQVTGSKFFTGPPFSGALLVPADLAVALREVRVPPGALSGYASRFDWPTEWRELRDAFPGQFNLGQWLRWEAALEELRLYYAVPDHFRDSVPKLFEQLVGHEIEKASGIAILHAPHGLAAPVPTIFPLILRNKDVPLSEELCAIAYRAMRRDLSRLAGTSEERDCLKAACQIGQAVALPGGRAALRIGLSARMIRGCWSPDPGETQARLLKLRSSLSAVIRKLDSVARLAPELSAV